MKLSIIFPFRGAKERPYLMDRLQLIGNTLENNSNVEYVLVDSGSPFELSIEIEELCKTNGIRYFFIDSRKDIFSIGKARDYGVQVSTGDLVTFLDVDLVPPPNFINNLIEYASLWIGNYKKEFFTIPCLYLTPEGSDVFLKTDAKNRHKLFFQHYMTGNKQYIQNLAPSSSIMVIQRSHYLAIGGHRPEFKGHGYEDFELVHRLATLSNRIPRSSNYYRDSKTWDNTIYDGFRANFSLFGRGALYSGLYAVHIWHPRPSSDGYESSRFMNHENALNLFKQFDQDGLNPDPLIDKTIEPSKTLFFGMPLSAAAECWRDAAPYLGEIVYTSEYIFTNKIEKESTNEFKFSDDNQTNPVPPTLSSEYTVTFDEVQFEKFIKYHNITRILFPNPYGNESRLKIYEWAKSKKFPFFCFERGALPDSWFFDANGFNADSLTYSSIKWDIPLSQDMDIDTDKYIIETLKNGKALETQGGRIGSDALKSRLRVGGKKVLFVPFQRPSDTVIKYFSGKIESVEQFAVVIDSIAAQLKPYGWIVLCKKHPLETQTPNLTNALCVEENTNFYDLLEMADAVALINSGVGIYAMMMGKPCYIFGEAFYAHPKINVVVDDYEKAADQILTGFLVCDKTTRRFIHHLINNVYSFGIAKTTSRQEADGSLRTITKGIDFYNLNLPNIKKIKFDAPENFQISLHSPLLEHFRYEILKRGKDTHPSKSSVSKPKTPNIPQKNKPFTRKLKKLSNDPKAFFADSNSSLLNLIGRILWK